MLQVARASKSNRTRKDGARAKGGQFPGQSKPLSSTLFNPSASPVTKVHLPRPIKPRSGDSDSAAGERASDGDINFSKKAGRARRWQVKKERDHSQSGLGIHFKLSKTREVRMLVLSKRPKRSTFTDELGNGLELAEIKTFPLHLSLGRCISLEF